MNIGELTIKQEMPSLSCDYEALEHWAKSITDKYINLVITEDQISEIKNDMAEINKAKSMLDRARIDAVKAISAPIREFELRIKSICSLFDNAYLGLKEQINKYEEERRAEKRKKIESIIQEETATFGKNFTLPHFTIEIKTKWLAKQMSFKAIRDEIRQDMASLFAKQCEAREVINNGAIKTQQNLSDFALGYNPDVDCQNLNLTQNKANSDPIQGQSEITNFKHWQMSFSYAAENENTIREVFAKNKFMSIVRELRNAGIRVDIKKG